MTYSLKQSLEGWTAAHWYLIINDTVFICILYIQITFLFSIFSFILFIEILNETYAAIFLLCMIFVYVFDNYTKI